MGKTYQRYHKHTSYSNVYTKDSPLVVKDYLDKFKEEGGKHIYSTVEHGYQSPYFRIYDELEQYNIKNGTDIKFIFGAEVYWVKDRYSDDRANCHMILLAKNDKGRKAINKAISIANKTGYYYKPRLDLELILGLPKDDVFVTTSCIVYWNKYEDIDEITLKLNDHFTDFFLEVQAHHTEEQRKLNQHILDLSREYNIPIIAGTDTHIIEEYQVADRDDLLKSAKMHYEDENGWFVDLPSYDELVLRFQQQGILSDEEIITAIENTNLILDFEDIVLDRSIKIPTLYPNLTQKQKDKIFIETIHKLWVEESKRIPETRHEEYKKQIVKELNEIIGCGMCDYFLTNKKIIEDGINIYGGELTQSGRGCFTEDALVHTKDTIKSIKDVEIGDYVITKDGKFNKVIDRMYYDINEEMVKITHLYGTDKHYPAICTLDHKILTKRDGELLWTEAKNLKKTDFVCVPKIKTEERISNVIDLNDYNIFGYKFDEEYIYEENTTLGCKYDYSPKSVAKKLGISSYTMDCFADMSCKAKLFSRKPEKLKELMEYLPFNTREEYCDYVKSKKIKKIKRFVKLDREFNTFIGLMYGDGFTIERGIGLAINPTTGKDSHNREVFQNIANRFNLTVSENRSKTRKLSQLYIHSKLFLNFIKLELFTSKKGKDKEFNNKWFSQDKECLLGIIDGLRLSDGSYAENRISFDNTSKSLINAYKLLCLMTGEGVNSLSIRKSHENCKESYKLRVNKNNKQYKEDDDYYYLPISNVEILEKQKVRVYDITVENEHNYLLNNMIVHNSNVAMYLNKLLGFTNIDCISAPIDMYSERFLTKERVLESKTPPDEDFNVSDREPFIKAQENLLGENCCYDLIAFGTLKLKSAFKMYARANDIDPQVANEVSKQIAKYEKALMYANEEDRESINVFDYVDEDRFGYVIEGCQRYLGIIDNRKGHPCGTIVSSCDIEEEVGIILCKSETTGKEVLTALIESITIDSFGWLKNDFLIVDSTRIINAIYKRIGIKPIEINELLELIKSDNKVWDIYANGLTQCVNQIEKPKTTQKMMRYKAKNIVELTQFIAGIRPSFKSLYSKFENREKFEYGIKALDNLLQNEYSPSSFILFQEDLMKILNFAGFPMKDTYTIIKAISKKKRDKIEKVKPKFISNFADRIKESGEAKNEYEAFELADKVWGIVEDFASYGFNSPHGFSYAIDSVTQAWQKANYPYEFYEVVLQRFTEKSEKDKVSLIKQEMEYFNIELKPIKFRDDNRKFTSYKDKGYITQPLNSIKNISKNTPDLLYNLRDLEVDNFVDFLIHITENDIRIDKTNMEILIKLDYFSEFGTINNLLEIYKLFKKEYNKSRTKKTKEKKKELLYNFQKEIDLKTSLLDKMKYEIETLGYTKIIDKSFDNKVCFITDITKNQYGTPFLDLYNISNGKTTMQLKVDRKYFEGKPMEKYEMIYIVDIKEKAKKRKIDGKWVDIGEKEYILSSYGRVVEDEGYAD